MWGWVADLDPRECPRCGCRSSPLCNGRRRRWTGPWLESEPYSARRVPHTDESGWAKAAVPVASCRVRVGPGAWSRRVRPWRKLALEAPDAELVPQQGGPIGGLVGVPARVIAPDHGIASSRMVTCSSKTDRMGTDLKGCRRIPQQGGARMGESSP